MILQLLGASGAGKSTLAKALSQKTGLPHLQSDHYLWPNEKFDIPRPVEERRRMLEEDLRQFPSFILDGDVTRWFPSPPFTPDLLVLLRCPEKERMERLRQRETLRYGQWEDPRHPHHQLTQEFLEWAACYDTAGEEEPNSLCSHLKKIAQAPCPALILWPESTETLLRRMLGAASLL